MATILRKLAGVDGTPLDLVKFLLLNVGGKWAAGVTVSLGTLYLLEPLLPARLAVFAGRAQWTCISFLIAIIFWRGIRNQELLVQTIAKQTIDDPNSANTSPDPAIQREIRSQIATATASGKDPRPPGV